MSSQATTPTDAQILSYTRRRHNPWCRVREFGNLRSDPNDSLLTLVNSAIAT